VAFSVQAEAERKIPNAESQDSKSVTADPPPVTQVPRANKGDASREKADKAEKQNLELTVRAVEAAEESTHWAELTLYMGWTGTGFIILTLIANAAATIANWRATNIATKQFIAAHRPRLKLRWSQVTRLETGQPIEVNIALANIGDTDAQIFRVGIDCVIRVNGAITNSDTSQIEYTNDPKIAPGREKTLPKVCACTPDDNEVILINSGAVELCLSATVIYKDNNGTARVTGIFRIHDPKRGVFVKATPDDDYADDDYEN
jgi:hypothetical protein